MFKLVVLSALFAAVAAKPSGIAPVAYAAPAVAIPAAVSSQYRTDVISKPIVATYAAAPAVAYAAPAPAVAYAAPAPAVAYAAPAVAVPAAVSHQSRVDVYSKPLITTYSAPAVYAAPVAYAGHYGYGYAAGW